MVGSKQRQFYSEVQFGKRFRALAGAERQYVSISTNKALKRNPIWEDTKGNSKTASLAGLIQKEGMYWQSCLQEDTTNGTRFSYKCEQLLHVKG